MHGFRASVLAITIAIAFVCGPAIPTASGTEPVRGVAAPADTTPVGTFTTLQRSLHGWIRTSVALLVGRDPWNPAAVPSAGPDGAMPGAAPLTEAPLTPTQQETFDELVQRSGFKIDAVVEGFTPLPMYCIALDKVYFASREVRDAAAAAVDAHFERQGTRWYDVWSQLEWAFLDFIASFESASASYASLFGMKMEGMDVHFLPIPYVEVSLIQGQDSSGFHEPPSEIAQLVRDYGYSTVRIDQNLGPLALLGLDLDVTILLRKTQILTPAERAAMRQRIEDYFVRQENKFSVKYVFDYLFFSSLMKVHEAINAVGTVQDLEVHDVIMNLSLLPSVRTRLRLADREKKGYEPPPCT